MNKVSIRAKVSVTLEIEVPDTWGTDCALSQVYSQAREKALYILSQTKIPGIKVLAPTVVTAIAYEQGASS